MPSCITLAAAACGFVALVALADAHGMMTKPRLRGALKCPKRDIQPRELTPDAPIDYCPHCANAGGRWNVKNHGGGHQWRPYKPMSGDKRGGFGLCGDPHGQYDHGKHGKYGNPKNFPYSAVYKPGGVANFEFDATANHGGYLEFYLCDVSQMPYNDISYEGFPHKCHHLKRIPHDSCESGHDRDCGPIDPKFPERWVLPCGSAGGDTGDQILGGDNGKMAYRIPNVYIEQGVIQMYWLTQNDCTEPEGFMENYDYPSAWAGCPGDGGSVGGKPLHHKKCGEKGYFPEEFWNCADVQVKHLKDGEPNPNDAYKRGYKGHHDHGHESHDHHGGDSQQFGYEPVDGSGGYDDGRASTGGKGWVWSWSYSSEEGYKSHAGPIPGEPSEGHEHGPHSDHEHKPSEHDHGAHDHGPHEHVPLPGGQTFHHKAEKKPVKEDGNCIKNYQFGCNNKRCCKEEFACRNNQCKE